MGRKILMLMMILLQALYCQAQVASVPSRLAVLSRANQQATTANRGRWFSRFTETPRRSGCPGSPPGAKRRLSQTTSGGYAKDDITYYYYTYDCEQLVGDECEFCLSSISPDTTTYTGDFLLGSDSFPAEDGNILTHATCAILDLTSVRTGANCYLCLLGP